MEESQALEKVLSFVNAKKYKWEDAAMERFAKQNSQNPNATYFPKGELVIVKDSLNNFQLAWKFVVSTLEPDDELLVIINAITGKLINKGTLILDNNVACVAQTLYSTNQNITGDTYTGGIRLSEVRNNVNIHTLSMRNQLNNYINAQEFSNNNTNWTTGNWANINQDHAALDAHWAGEMVFDYWHSVHNRNSIDGSGIPVIGYVHFYVSNSPAGWPDNAAWVPGNNNHFMEYGDGDGTTFRPFVALDIAAHEFGHGVNEFTSNLGTVNHNQEEDALNEGLSDIWGISVKNFAAPNKPLWLLGGEILLNSAYNCNRNAQDPKSTLAEEGRHPNTYHGQYWNSNGEPHTNSTVLSHWFYLLSQGGSGTNDNSDAYNVNNIGINEAQQIVYQAEAHHLQPGDEYADARNAMKDAATDLYCANSPEVVAVTNAWYAVGVGGAYSGNVMSVSDSLLLCTTHTYMVMNQPTGINTITWATGNPYIATITNAGVATRVGNDTTTIYATVAGSSGCATTLSQQVYVGVPKIFGTYSDYNGQHPMQFWTGNSSSYNSVYNSYNANTNMDILGDSIITWSKVSSNPSSITWHQSGDDISFYFWQINQTGVFKINAQNICGSNSDTYGFISENPNGGGDPCDVFMVSPNPASNSIQIGVVPNLPAPCDLSLLSQATGQDNPKVKSTMNRFIQSVSIYNNKGTLLQQHQYNATNKQATLNVSGLPTGIYVVRIMDGAYSETHQLVIK